MAGSETIEAARGQAARWLQQQFKQQSPEDFQIIPIQHLSTPHFVFLLIEQKKLRTAGDLYVMSDGEDVLAASRKSFEKMLAHEKFLDNPAVISPRQFAELYLKLAEARQDGILDSEGDDALSRLSAEARAQFAPPHIQQNADGVIAYYWTTRHRPFEITRWEIHVSPDYTVVAQQTRMMP